MTLNETIFIAGLRCVPTLTEGEKSQLQLVFPDLPKKLVKDKKTGEKVAVQQTMSKRAISDVTKYFSAVTDPGARQAMSEMQLPESNAVIAKAVKEGDSTALDFYLEAQSLIDSMESEVESVSAADPSNIIGQFLAATFTGEDIVPTPETFLQVLQEKIAGFFSAEKIKSTLDLMVEKESELGRLDSGQIRWRKPRKAAGTEEAAKTE